MRQVIAMILVVGALAGVTGCLGSQNVGYLQGQVTIGPICPVERQNVTCPVPPEAYAARKVIVSAEDASTVMVVDINSTGFYQTALSPGTYTVDINHGGMDRSSDVPTAVTIVSGQTVVLNISIDTGIR